MRYADGNLRQDGPRSPLKIIHAANSPVRRQPGPRAHGFSRVGDTPRGAMESRETLQAAGQAPTHAEARITVRSSDTQPFDQAAGPLLTEVRISETFTGDIEGESTVRALQMRRDDKSASMVSLQR